MNTELIGFFASSEDATKVSMRITAVLVGASSLIIGFSASVLHISINAGDVTQLATGLGLVGGAIFFLVGIFKVLIHKFGKVS